MLVFTKKMFIALNVIFLCIIFTLPGTADDATTLLKKVNKELRQAERDMFSGKTEKALAALENIETDIGKIKTDDPTNPKLKTAENKFNKLVKDLERRTGKQLGGRTLSSEAVSSTSQLPAKPKAKELTTGNSQNPKKISKHSSNSGTENLPYAARKPMTKANRTLSSLEGNLTKLNDSGYSGNKDQLVSNIEKKIETVKESLNQAKQLAAEKGINSHPDFAAIELQITAAEKDIATAKSGHEKNKAAVAASAKQVDTDVADLKGLYDKVQPVFDKAIGYVFQYNDLKTVEEVIVQIENFEKNDLKNVKSKTNTFAAIYGTTKNDIDKKAESMGYAGTYYRASYPYAELLTGIENVAKTRIVMADDLARRVNSELDGISKGHDFHVVERFEKVKGWIKMAERYGGPDLPKVKELNNTIDQKIEEGMKEFHARVDGRTWPSHSSNAPSNATELAQSSLEWFKNSPDWGKRSSKIRHPLAVMVTGPWSVQKNNLLGEPIMYGLPIKLAVKVDSDKELNVARVYILTMRTAERRGVKKEPPFDHITVGDSYLIRPDKVK